MIILTVIRPPGTVVREVYSARDVFFFRHAFFKVPRPIAAKHRHMVGNCLNYIIQVQKFGGSPQKNLGAKNMQNFGRLYTTSDFDREYLRNGSRYQKSES